MTDKTEDAVANAMREVLAGVEVRIVEQANEILERQTFARKRELRDVGYTERQTEFHQVWLADVAAVKEHRVELVTHYERQSRALERIAGALEYLAGRQGYEPS